MADGLKAEVSLRPPTSAAAPARCRRCLVLVGAAVRLSLLRFRDKARYKDGEADYDGREDAASGVPASSRRAACACACRRWTGACAELILPLPSLPARWLARSLARSLAH